MSSQTSGPVYQTQEELEQSRQDAMPSEEGATDEDTKDDTVDDTPTETHLLLENLSFMSEFVGNKDSSTAINFLNDAILYYLSNSTPGEYTGSVPGRTIQKTVSFPYNVCSFILDLSNDTSYYTQIALVKDNYYGMLVSQYPVNTNSIDKFYIVFFQNANQGSYDRDNVITDLTNWAKNATPNAFTLTTKNLFE